MQLTNHGGHCCGRRHIYGMNGETTDSIMTFMHANNLDDEDVNKLTEIVVSEENEDLEELRHEIVAAGFKLVAEWENCSGSRCYCYLHANDWTHHGPDANAVVEAPPAPAPIPASIIASTFHNVLRAGRSAAGWPNLAAARRAARGASVDRCDYWSNGRVEWSINVH